MASPCDPDLFDFFAQFNVLLKSKQNANLTMKCRNGRASVILKLDIDIENKNNHRSSCQLLVHENSRSRRRKKRAFERQCKKQNEQNDANATTCNAQMKPLLQLRPLTKIKNELKMHLFKLLQSPWQQKWMFRVENHHPYPILQCLSYLPWMYLLLLGHQHLHLQETSQFQYHHAKSTILPS